MKSFARLLAIALLSLPTMAIAQNLQQYQPGPRLIDGTQLNQMVNVVNGMAGGGTAGPGTFTTLTTTGNASIANTKLTVNATTGATGITGATTITSSSALALAVGRQGATNPALRVDAATAASLTGLRITAAGTGAGLAVAVVETGGTNNALTIDAMGSGTVTINGTATGGITLARATTLSSTLIGGASSDITINTDKFTVAAATGNTVVAGTLGVTGVANFTAVPVAPVGGITLGSTTFTEAALALYTKGVAAGYKIARGETALDGSNPTPVTTGLASIVACSLSVKIAASTVLSTSMVTYDTTAGTMNMYGWKPTGAGDVTLIASDGTQTVGWVCVGT